MKPTLLRGSLVLLVLIGQILSICFVLLGTQKQAAEQFTTNAEVKLANFANSVADTTEYFLAPAVDAVVVGRSLLHNGVISSDDDPQLERYFLAKLKSLNSLSGIYFGRPDGSFIFVNRGAEGFRTKRITLSEKKRKVLYQQYGEHGPLRTWGDENDTYDPRQRPWYTRAGKSESLIWTDPYTFFSSGKPGLSAAISVFSKAGELLGVIGVDVDISDISEFLATEDENDTGTAIIVDESLQVVAYSGGLSELDNTSSAKHALLTDIPDEALAELFGQHDSAGYYGTKDTDHSIQLMINDVQHIGLVRKFSVQGNESQWILMAQTPESVYSGGVIELFAQDIWVLIATVLIPGLIMAALVMRITAPVERYYREASIDQLTGALTRTEFIHRIGKLVRNVSRSDDNTQLIIAVLDLDGFKAVNDNFDHSEGDAVLTEIAKRLQRRIRSGDLVGRLGGDEFILAIRTKRDKDCMETVDSVRRRTVSEPIVTAHAEHQVGMTAGVALWKGDDSLDDAINRADRALVNGKRVQKNRCYLESDDDQNENGMALQVVR